MLRSRRILSQSLSSRLVSLSPYPKASAPTIEAGGPKATPRLEIAKRHTAPGVGRLTDVSLVEGRGAFMLTDQNEVLLDFATGIGACVLGHSHPDVVQAVQEQAGKISHAQVNISFHSQQLDLVERLKSVMPSGLDSFFFWNGGADAVEASWKVARQATGRPNIVVVKGGYHGRTFGTMGLTTSKTIYSKGFGPFVPGVHVTPFPYCLHCSSSKRDGAACCGEPLEQLEELLLQQSAPEDTAAVLLEPVLGEGGYVVPPPGYLKQLRALCSKHDILLIADEVQSGFGRTGRMFAVDHEEVVPDILVFAKGVANGHVLSGIAASPELLAKQPAGSMGGTYAGSAIGCAAANAVIEVMQRDNILQNVEERGEQLRSALRELQSQHPDVIRDVRGQGLMVGVEFQPELTPAFAAEVSRLCLHQGMVLLTTSIFPTVRFIPPLNITADELSLGIDIFASALSKAIKR